MTKPQVDVIASVQRRQRWSGQEVCDRRRDADYRIGRCRDCVGADQGACDEQSAAMIPFPSGARVRLAAVPCRHAHRLRQSGAHGPGGALFVIRCRRGGLIKVLWYDGQGL